MTLFAPAASAAQALPSDLTIVIPGGGWGHGHGMSQYGARGRAEAGDTWRQILGHYYTGVSIEDRGNPMMRVLISASNKVVVGGPEAYTVRWGNGGFISRRTNDAPFTRIVATTDGIVVATAPDNDGPWTRVVEADKTKVIVTPDEGPAVPVWQHGRHEYFRDRIEAYRRGGSTMYGINELRLDEYLYGVVPREMPASWHGQALRAQAVAARSYSRWKRNSVGSSASYHICATTACQVYRGYAVREPGQALQVLEHSRSTAAVDATSGQTMVVDGEGPIFAEYHSTSGGATSRGSRSYLAPVLDPHDELSPYHRWTATATVADIERAWPALGTLTGFGAVERTGVGPWGGHVEQLKLLGTDSNVTVTGASFRAALGLRASLFAIRIYDAEPDGDPAQVVLGPGGSATAVVRMRNTGTARWPVGKDVRIATSSPKGRDSAFASSGWITPSRPGEITRDLGNGDDWVKPGEVAEFRFDLVAPAGIDGGLYEETFRLHLRNTTWFGEDVAVPVRVGFAGASHLGGNLLENPSFEAAASGDPDGWTRVSGPDADLEPVSVDGANGLRLEGVRDGRTRYRQIVDVRGSKGDRFVVSAWNRAEGTRRRGGAIDVTAAFIRTSGDRVYRRMSFPSGPHGWAFEEAAFDAPRRYKGVEVTLGIRDQSGSTWFDRVRLTRNEVVNGGFEDGASAWSVSPSSLARPARGQMAQGWRSLRLDASDGANVVAKQGVAISGDAGDKIRLSGWSASKATRPDRGPIQLQVRLTHADGSRSSERVRFPRAPHDWVYGEATFEVPKDFVGAQLIARLGKQRGAAWFDDIGLAPVTAAEPLAENPSFELGDPDAAAWELFQVGPDGAALSGAAPAGDTALKIAGQAGKNRHAEQRLPLGGVEGDRFRLGAWNRTAGSDPDGGPVRVWVRVHYVNGSVGKFVLNFDRSTHDWTSDAVVFRVDRDYVGVDVEAKFANQSGEAFFDLITLERLG